MKQHLVTKRLKSVMVRVDQINTFAVIDLRYYEMKCIEMGKDTQLHYEQAIWTKHARLEKFYC